MSDQQHVLLIEDDPPMARVYQEYLRKEPYRISHSDTGRAGLEVLHGAAPDATILDLRLPDMNGLEILRAVREERIPTSVIVITAQGSIVTAVEAMREGAADFIVKPFAADRLIYTLRNVLERRRLSRVVESLEQDFDRGEYGGFIGGSLAMQAVYRMIDKAAPSKATVFITGESGTGKELCAEAIHGMSPRAKRPFIVINCAAIPKDLIESEVFGHVKGAFTGAIRDRDGAAKLADGGTLFLDEICEMDPNLQTKLLRFVQTGAFQRVGDGRQETVDVRFVCATNRAPLEEIKAGRFREDLYYRLHVVPIHLPPLRERDDDLVRIARRFLTSYTAEEGKAFTRFTPACEEILRAYPWPGNVRQLQNVVRNTVVMNDGEAVTPDMLPAPLDRFAAEAEPGGQPAPRRAAGNDAASRDEAASETAAEPGDSSAPEVNSAPIPLDPSRRIVPMARLEREAIERAIELCGGNVPRAAHHLGISGATIYRKRAAWQKEAEGSL